jgi:hypothetical protein
MKRKTLYTVVAAALFALGGSTWAADQDRDQLRTQDQTRDTLQTQDQLKTQDRTRDRLQTKDQTKDGPIYGSQLMTSQERIEYRNRMRAAKTAKEREQIRLEHHAQMQERAKERGVTLPDEPPARGLGRGMGPGAGMGGGAGPGAGSGMGPGGGMGGGRR